MTNAVRFSSNRPSAPETHVHRISRKFQVAIDFDLKCSITAKYAILFRWNPTGFFFHFATSVSIPQFSQEPRKLGFHTTGPRNTWVL